MYPVAQTRSEQTAEAAKRAREAYELYQTPWYTKLENSDEVGVINVEQSDFEVKRDQFTEYNASGQSNIKELENWLKKKLQSGNIQFVVSLKNNIVLCQEKIALIQSYYKLLCDLRWSRAFREAYAEQCDKFIGLLLIIENTSEFDLPVLQEMHEEFTVAVNTLNVVASKEKVERSCMKRAVDACSKVLSEGMSEVLDKAKYIVKQLSYSDQGILPGSLRASVTNSFLRSGRGPLAKSSVMYWESIINSMSNELSLITSANKQRIKMINILRANITPIDKPTDYVQLGTEEYGIFNQCLTILQATGMYILESLVGKDALVVLKRYLSSKKLDHIKDIKPISQDTIGLIPVLISLTLDSCQRAIKSDKLRYWCKSSVIDTHRTRYENTGIGALKRQNFELTLSSHIRCILLNADSAYRQIGSKWRSDYDHNLNDFLQEELSSYCYFTQASRALFISKFAQIWACDGEYELNSDNHLSNELFIETNKNESSIDLDKNDGLADELFIETNKNESSIDLDKNDGSLITNKISEDISNVQVIQNIKENISSDEIITEKISSDEIITENISSEEIKTEKISSDEIKTENISSDEIITENISSEEIKTENISSEEIKTENISSEEIKTENISFKPFNDGSLKKISQSSTTPAYKKTEAFETKSDTKDKKFTILLNNLQSENKSESIFMRDYESFENYNKLSYENQFCGFIDDSSYSEMFPIFTRNTELYSIKIWNNTLESIVDVERRLPSDRDVAAVEFGGALSLRDRSDFAYYLKDLDKDSSAIVTERRNIQGVVVNPGDARGKAAENKALQQSAAAEFSVCPTMQSNKMLDMHGRKKALVVDGVGAVVSSANCEPVWGTINGPKKRLLIESSKESKENFTVKTINNTSSESQALAVLLETNHGHCTCFGSYYKDGRWGYKCCETLGKGGFCKYRTN